MCVCVCVLSTRCNPAQPVSVPILQSWMIRIGARVTQQGVVRHGRNMVLPLLLLDAHPAARRLIMPKVQLLWSLFSAPKDVNSSPETYLFVVRDHGGQAPITLSVVEKYLREKTSTININTVPVYTRLLLLLLLLLLLFSH